MYRERSEQTKKLNKQHLFILYEFAYACTVYIYNAHFIDKMIKKIRVDLVNKKTNNHLDLNFTNAHWELKNNNKTRNDIMVCGMDGLKAMDIGQIEKR